MLGVGEESGSGVDQDSPTPVDAYFDGFSGRKSLSDYADPISTGRKEAAVKFPLKPGMVCEWAFQKNCGGGVEPIVGCPGYPAQAIHHGPDKNTMRNVEGNVHRICHNCHNRWHALNDPHYGPRPTTPDGKVDATVPFTPGGNIGWEDSHNPEQASDEEIFEEEAKRRDYARAHGNL